MKIQLQLDLSRELWQFVDDAVASGRYASREELFQFAIEELRQFDEELKQTIAALNEGTAEIAAGRGMTLDEAFDEITRTTTMDPAK